VTDSPRFIIFVLILFYFLALNLTYASLWLTSVLHGKRFVRRSGHTNFGRIAESPLTIPISVIVPAYNERSCIVDGIYSILKSDHPALEIIVVDDGSTDDTLETIQSEFDLQVVDLFYPAPLHTAPILRTYKSSVYPQLTVVAKANGGKADAVNAGINISRYRFVTVTDADTVFHPQALLRASNVVNQDPGRIVAIGGQVRVKNGLTIERGAIVRRGLPDTLVARFQQVEYAGAFLGNRVGWNVFNGTPVLSGAFAIWRRDFLIAQGGMSKETTHEDIEITLHAHAYHRNKGELYLILCVPDAVVWTEVPFRWRDLYNQRKRWQRVVYEVVWRYRRMLFNPRYGTVGWITMPYLFIYEAAGPWIEVTSYILVIYFLVSGWLSVQLLILFLIVSFGFSAFLRILSVLLDVNFFASYPPRSVFVLSGLALIESFVYRPVILVSRLQALFEFLAGRKTWERVQRVDGYGAP
jgi:cellulose synthase/poly-beta-1,6-N-acetylglucosamine synthase-like glycosyltransferase